ncbi:MAG: hypothetical protein OEO82_00700 [Gammaproteobacteria bacterium]|nr:hypothetical protein [Gammaproteobacteria bacterium]
MRFFGKKAKEKLSSITKSAHDNPDNSSKYRGVQVNPNQEICCAAVRAMVGKRFLSHEVPALPLDDCDADDCRCSYELFSDRRTDYRRKAGVVSDVAGQILSNDQRSSKTRGRRRED